MRYSRRRFAVLALVGLPLLFLLPVGGWLWYLDSQVASIPRFDAGLDRPDRPEPVGSGGESSRGDDDESGTAVNLLLVGVDAGNGIDLQDALQAPTWPIGVFRSDTVMVLHLDADRSGAQLISIPRDSYVPVPGHGTTKINAAFSYGGPPLLVRTIEDYTAMRLDHVAVVDWGGFDGLLRVVGGVDVIGADGRPMHLDGRAALDYVRERKSLPRGDFSRIQRQQDFLRSVLDKIADAGVLRNPWELTDLVEESSEFLAVDDGLDNRRILQLARDHRDLRADDIDYLTIPTRGTAMVSGASIVRVDRDEVRALFDAVARDQYGAWYARQQHVDELPPPSQIP